MLLAIQLVLSLTIPPLPGRVDMRGASRARSGAQMYQPNVVPSIDAQLEECILEAKSEDEVQDCMQRFENELELSEPDPELSELDACIVSAKSEDGVQECISAAHFTASKDELSASVEQCQSAAEIKECLDASEWSNPTPTGAVSQATSAPSRTLMEECIVSASNEDEVKMCLEMEFDEEVTASEPLNALDECILWAGSEDGVKACLEAEEARVDSFDKLRSALAAKLRAATSDADMEACIHNAEMRLA